MQLFKFFTPFAFLSGNIGHAASLDTVPDFALILSRQAPGTPKYECHFNCGNALAGGRNPSHCSNSTWTEYYQACLHCALEFNIWSIYGNGVSDAAKDCGLINAEPPPPSPSSSSSGGSGGTESAGTGLSTSTIIGLSSLETGSISGGLVTTLGLTSVSVTGTEEGSPAVTEPPSGSGTGGGASGVIATTSTAGATGSGPAGFGSKLGLGFVVAPVLGLVGL